MESDIKMEKIKKIYIDAMSEYLEIELATGEKVQVLNNSEVTQPDTDYDSVQNDVELVFETK